MGVELYRDLAWLPPAPADFRARCRAVSSSKVAAGAALHSLAQSALDMNGLSQLAKAVERLRTDGADLTPLLPFRLGVLSNATSAFLLPALVVSGLRHGLAVQVQAADYGQVLQTAIDPASAVHACDAVLLAIDLRGLPLTLAAVGDAAGANAQVDAACAYLEVVRSAMHANGSTTCLVQTIARPPEALFGNADRRVDGTWLLLAQQLNARIARSLDRGDLLVDVAAMAETVGLANWHDPKAWHLAKLPFALDYVPWYADQVCRVLAAARGRSRKVLALDLDNTLWAGVVGEDGVDGIAIGQGDAAGEAHLDLQGYALALRSRGIVLAVSSKNEDAVARQPFRTHPDMLLREDHIAVFQANWQDKPSNLRSIAAELNVGVDTLTLLDDHAMERDLVRQTLPEVGVPELAGDPALYARTLAAAGYFEATGFSDEDRQRAAYYQDDARRAMLQKQVTNLDEYLLSLAMEIFFGPFDAVTRGRVVQLIQKSNQFNLTTRRYTEIELAALQDDPTVFGMHVRLRDKLGDNGIISVVICRTVGSDWEIDTWLMSCRVLGRRVEHAVLRQLLTEARRRGIRRLIGRFRPTDRNGIVRDHYRTLGFHMVEELADGATVWQMETSAEFDAFLPMTAHTSFAQGTAA